MKTFFLLAFSLLALACYSQRPFYADEGVPVNPQLIDSFQSARCLQRGDTTELLDAYTFHRFRQLAPFYKPMATYPFCIYFREGEEGPLYLLFKGFCRGMHVTVPVVYRGFYYVAILDAQQPSLLVADTRQREMRVRYAAACVLH